MHEFENFKFVMISRRITFLGGLLNRGFRARGPSFPLFLEDSLPLLAYFASLFQREMRDATAFGKAPDASLGRFKKSPR
jgi:hypothetical protein